MTTPALNEAGMLPCPFCGGPVPVMYGVQVICESCGAGTLVHDTPEQAIAAWNRRALTASKEPGQEPPERDLVEQLTGALRFIIAFYEPGQRHLDTEAWKHAEAGGRAALARGEAAIKARAAADRIRSALILAKVAPQEAVAFQDRVQPWSGLRTALERISALTPEAANAATARELHLTVRVIADTALAAANDPPAATRGIVPGAGAGGHETPLEWAVWRWHDEVANRPLENIHRGTLDATWRQVIRHFGGDPNDLCGPCPFCARLHSRVSGAGFDCPPIGQTKDGDFTPIPAKADALVGEDESFLTAYVSRDGKVVGIEHPTEADWAEVLRAHEVLRDRLIERIAEKDNCPFKPTSPKADALVAGSLDEIWDTATNAVCQRMQDCDMCKCPDGDCLAAKISPEIEDRVRFAALEAAPPKADAWWSDPHWYDMYCVARGNLAALEASTGGAETGWQDIETAPVNRAILIHIPDLDYYGNDGVYAGMLVDMGTGKRWMTFGWAIGRDLDAEPVAWREIPAPVGERKC